MWGRTCKCMSRLGGVRNGLGAGFLVMGGTCQPSEPLEAAGCLAPPPGRGWGSYGQQTPFHHHPEWQGWALSHKRSPDTTKLSKHPQPHNPWHITITAFLVLLSQYFDGTCDAAPHKVRQLFKPECIAFVRCQFIWPSQLIPHSVMMSVMWVGLTWWACPDWATVPAGHALLLMYGGKRTPPACRCLTAREG